MKLLALSFLAPLALGPSCGGGDDDSNPPSDGAGGTGDVLEPVGAGGQQSSPSGGNSSAGGQAAEGSGGAESGSGGMGGASGGTATLSRAYEGEDVWLAWVGREEVMGPEQYYVANAAKPADVKTMGYPALGDDQYLTHGLNWALDGSAIYGRFNDGWDSKLLRIPIGPTGPLATQEPHSSLGEWLDSRISPDGSLVLATVETDIPEGGDQRDIYAIQQPSGASSHVYRYEHITFGKSSDLIISPGNSYGFGLTETGIVLVALDGTHPTNQQTQVHPGDPGETDIRFARWLGEHGVLYQTEIQMPDSIDNYEECWYAGINAGVLQAPVRLHGDLMVPGTAGCTNLRSAVDDQHITYKIDGSMYYRSFVGGVLGPERTFVSDASSLFSHPFYTRDGEYMLYSYLFPDEEQLIAMKVREGDTVLDAPGAPRELATFDDGTEVFITYTDAVQAAGDHVIFLAGEPEGKNLRLYLSSVSGKFGPRRLSVDEEPLGGVFPATLKNFSLSPDGRSVAYVIGDYNWGLKAYVVSLEDEDLHSHLVAEGFGYINLNWSVSGQTLAIGVKEDESGTKRALHLLRVFEDGELSVPILLHESLRMDSGAWTWFDPQGTWPFEP